MGFVQAQAGESSEVFVQTEGRGVRDAGSGGGVGSGVGSGVGVGSVDMAKLAAFLGRVEEELSRELCKGEAAFGRMESGGRGDAAASLSHALKAADLPDPDAAQGLALDWNCAGTTVAMGTGVAAHDDWCTHAGAVATWNVERRKLDPGKADHLVELATCVTALRSCCLPSCSQPSHTALIAFPLRWHPSLPSRLAVGAFNGDVSVVDLALADAKAASLVAADSKGGAVGHKDPVSDLRWMPGSVDPFLPLFHPSESLRLYIGPHSRRSRR